MMRYQDFVPQMTAPGGFLTPAEYESFDRALEAANAWIKENDLRVMNIETVVLPNIWSPQEQGSGDTSLRTSGDFLSNWHQFIRVWYQVG
jgi:hypothetical protein